MWDITMCFVCVLNTRPRSLRYIPPHKAGDKNKPAFILKTEWVCKLTCRSCGVMVSTQRSPLPGDTTG